MEQTDVSRQVAKLLIRIKAVTFRFKPPYTYTSGIKSPIYLDNRLIISYPQIRKKIIGYYLDVIRRRIGIRNIEWISATASAAIPHGAWVAESLNLPMVFVRPTTKTYGKGNQIEGYLESGRKILIIEDHISTGTSVVENARALRKAGGKVQYCVATTTYETKKSLLLFRRNKLKLFPLTTGRKILDTAYQERLLSLQEKEIVELWFSDPVGWGKKMGY